MSVYINETNYQKKNPRNGVNLARGKAAGPQDKVDHHCANNRGHERRAYEEGVPVLKRSTRRELEYEVVVDPCVLPHEKIASMHEHVQA